MKSFNYNVNPARIVFGEGRTAELAGEMSRLNASRALVITTEAQKANGDALLSQLGSMGGTLFSGAVMHTPVEITARAMGVLQANSCDCLVALGGGSTIGLAKALAVRTGLPQIAIPTTYAGSEVTPVLGETENGVKTTRTADLILPKVVIYDVLQTLSLPPLVSASSALNAIAHAAEALYSQEANPIISLMAEEGIAALVRSLDDILADPRNLEARSQAQYGAWLCGTCLGSVGMALHHKLCHVLGGTFNLPHAETHAIILPYSLAYNAAAAPEAMRILSRALGVADRPWIALHELLHRLGLPSSLAAIGMPENGIDRAVELSLQARYWNPRPLEAEPLRKLFQAALVGEMPSVF
ncbi:maleylacetate reductase [Pseudomonas citronellolis]|uniref:maleylacetate reductase n=1 Tax=Pseudomonas citronellolis TaxID=53408 RepID=UPI000853BB6E|nr:maleylacetate reductase [Pseudomonas humi]